MADCGVVHASFSKWNMCKNIHKNIEIHTTHTIVSWPNPKQWAIVHTSVLMMIIRQSIYIISIITREMGKLKTHIPTYCMMDNWENIHNNISLLICLSPSIYLILTVGLVMIKLILSLITSLMKTYAYNIVSYDINTIDKATLHHCKLKQS